MDFEKSSIERLKRTLYSRDEKKIPKEKRTPVSGRTNSVPTDWGTTSNFDIHDEEMTKSNSSFFNKFLIGSFGFFIVCLAIAGYIFFGGFNTISSENLEMKVAAPSSVSSGEEVTMDLSITNTNRTDLEQAVLFIDYPEGALSAGENKLLSRDKIDLGTISSGQSKDQTVRAILSGEKESIKSFNFRIEYKVKGSNAVFSKVKQYDVVISSSPIILNVTNPSEINSGQDLSLSIDIISNSNVVMKNAVVKVEYPYGFTYKNSNIKPVRDNSVWNIGNLKNGEKKNLLITGTLIGQNLEDRSFKISAGSQDPGAVSDFEIALVTNTTTIGIRKSLFDMKIVADSVSKMGMSIPVTVNWQNILPDKILNTVLTATISGNIVDRSLVQADNGGYYRSVDNVIVWDKIGTKELENISSGDSGRVSFSVASLPSSSQTNTIKNPYININVRSTGDRSGVETGEVSSNEDFMVKIASVFALSAKSYRNFGPFTNTGPIPPQADKESTYTITWVLTNTSNDLKNAVVTATLPVGVDWKEEISPVGEKVSYDSEKRIVTWNVGNISFGTGYSYSPKSVSFKLGIIPSISQVDSTPNLLTGVSAVATDTYAEVQLVSSTQSVSTQFSDPNYNGRDGSVIK